MAIALVGSAGAISNVSAATVTPAFGQATTVGNLLVARVAAVGNVTIATTASGWVAATQGTSSPGAGASAVFYKPNCGAVETAPTFTATGATWMAADLSEYSGIATTSPLDRIGTATGTGSVELTASNTPTPVDTAGGELFIGCAVMEMSKTCTYTAGTDVYTPSGGTVLTAGATHNTGSTKQAQCFGGTAYVTPNNSLGDAWHLVLTQSTGTGSGASGASASFLPVSTVVGPLPVAMVVKQAINRAANW